MRGCGHWEKAAPPELQARREALEQRVQPRRSRIGAALSLLWRNCGEVFAAMV